MPVMNLFPSGSTVQIPLDAPTSFSATAGNAQVELTWTDPFDKYATPEGEVSETGDQLVSEWDHTVLVRKTGSQPAGPNDGTVVTSSSVRNQYQTNGYTDTGLINDTVYYYAVFAYNKDGVASEGAFVSATPQAATPLGDLTEGTLISINENGAPVEFYVACQNYESALNGEGRVLCVRKDYTDFSLAFALAGNEYANGQMDVWLNKTYINRLSDQVKSLIGETTIIYFKRTGGNWDPTQLTRAVFVYSVGEYGKTDSGDGTSPLPISDVLHSACPFAWTRTGVGYNEAYAGTNTSSKYRIVSADAGNCDTVPCFTLPSTALVDSNLALIETA